MDSHHPSYCARVGGILILLLLLPVLLHAGSAGKIAGRVSDATTGEPVPFANVLVMELRTGAATDADGYYAIINVPPGLYTVRASIVGYSETRVMDVRVSIDFTTRIDIKLQPSSVRMGEVTVVAEKQLIRKDLTSSSATVSADQITAMPVESLQDILQLQAGVVISPGGDLHVRGGRASEVSFMVDGVSVTDPYSGSASVDVGSEVIQELKFVSGTFNAEYGQVMSGVVDVVTKDGGPKLSGQITAYTGDYVSPHNDTFLNIDRIKPFSINSIQGSLSGPVPFLSDNLRFFVSTRHDYNEGWLYGKRVYLPTDSSNFDSPDPSKWYIQKSGDGAVVPMNDTRRLNLQAKLTLSFEGGLKIAYNGLYTRDAYHLYDHPFKYNPDASYQYHSYGYTHIGSFTHVLSPSAFYSVKVSDLYSSYKSYVYEDPLDLRYVDPRRLYTKGAFSFHVGGTGMGHFERSSKAVVAKVDFTSQMNRENLVKAGIEFKWNQLTLHEYDTEIDQETNWKAAIPRPDSYRNNEYVRRPIEGALYVQDKVEVGDIVLNLGLRYDYFNSRGVVPIDPRDPNGSYAHNPHPYKDASSKHQLSPRLGIAYPITDRGVIHFSYGHFFQIPQYEYLYVNPDFKIIGGSLSSRVGNADLKPQKTVIYEVGLQQQLFEGIAFDVTGFYKDLRNLLGTEVHELYILGDSYAKYVNLDYGNVRGVTFAAQARISPRLSVNLDYTYQVAEGNASDPNAQFYNRQSVPPRADEVQVLPLDWDQTHTLNFSVNVGDPSDWTIGLLGRLESGLPYTPEVQNLRVEFQNSGRKPPKYTFDLKMQKRLSLFGVSTTAFLKVYNLLDTRNEGNVYYDTGRAGYTLVSRYAGDVRGVNTLADYLDRPDFYCEPRKVLMGLSFMF